MEHILTLSVLIILLLSGQTCSTTNYVTYTRDSTASDEILLNSQTKYEMNINLSRSPPLPVYCNDYRNLQGHEGSSRPGFTLRQVHVVLTPGHTKSPVDTSDHQLHIPEPACQFQPRSEDSHKINSFTETSDIYSTVQHDKHAFKHFHPILGSSCTASHLTNIGIKQSIAVGEHLSNSYFSNSDIKLKPTSASMHAESIVDQSSYQSLLAFLHGLLPEKAFAKTKVHKTSGNFCHFARESAISCRCPKAEVLYKPVWQVVQRGRFMFKEGYSGKDTMNSIFTEISTQNLSPLELFQVLTFHACDSVDVICDRSNSCVNISATEHIRPLTELVSSFLQTLSNDATFQLFSQLYTFPFFHQLVSKIDMTESDEKFHIYSGDGFYLHILLTSLGIRFEGPIPKASRLVFEVYQKNRGQPNEGSLYFSILYNGVEVTDQLDFCGDGLQEGLCSANRLREEVDKLQKTYQQKC